MLNYDLNKALPKPVAGAATEVPAHPTLNDANNFNIRAVERGSKIVTVDPGTRTVLQMPRGNLEGIFPRLIVLNKVIEDIEQRRYGKAFKLLRQHKIDINLLYDVNPAQFLANIPLFVTQLDNKADYLNLFINSLVDDERGPELEFIRPSDPEEVLAKEHQLFMIHKMHSSSKESSSEAILGKVNKVCEELKKELILRNQQNGSNEFLLPILTVYVKKNP